MRQCSECLVKINRKLSNQTSLSKPSVKERGGEYDPVRRKRAEEQEPGNGTLQGGGESQAYSLYRFELSVTCCRLGLSSSKTQLYAICYFNEGKKKKETNNP